MSNPPHKALFNTRLPIIQAPMAGVQNSALAIAICQTGGLGSLPCAMLSIEQMVAEISTIQQATEQPFNVNFFCHSPAEAALQDQQQANWLKRLAPYYQELGIAATAKTSGPSRQPFNDAIADALEPLAPPIVSFHFGLPEARLLQKVKNWGGQVWSTATTVKEALWLEANGADAIIVQGLEAGGHRGMFLTTDITTQTGLVALLPQIANQVQLPLIAAGGIAGSEGIKAALGLGAQAVQLGTSFLLCDEATTSPLHRAALTSSAASHTALTNVFSGRPARGIVNRLMKDLDYMHSGAPDFPTAGTALAPLKAAAEKKHSSDFSSLWSGQNNSGCRAVAAGELLQSWSDELGM